MYRFSFLLSLALITCVLFAAPDKVDYFAGAPAHVEVANVGAGLYAEEAGLVKVEAEHAAGKVLLVEDG